MERDTERWITLVDALTYRIYRVAEYTAITIK